MFDVSMQKGGCLLCKKDHAFTEQHHRPSPEASGAGCRCSWRRKGDMAVEQEVLEGGKAILGGVNGAVPVPLALSSGRLLTLLLQGTEHDRE